MFFAVLFYFFCRHGSIFQTMFFPFPVALKISAALHQCLRVGIDIRDIGKFCIRKSKQCMIDLDNLLPDDAVIVFYHQVIIFRYDARWRILNRKHRIICLSVFDRLHGITPGFHMITVRLLSKVLSQCKLAVRTLCPLKHNTRIVII